MNFGSAPGGYEASVAVTGQAGIVGGSLVEAWVFPTATADHSADEHLIDPPRVIAGNVVAGTGFTIYAYAQPGYAMNDPEPGRGVTQDSPKSYGQWTVAWVWN